MMNYAVIENGVVTNIAVWDGETEWAQDGVEIVPADDGIQIGWLYNIGVFTPPSPLMKTHEEMAFDAEQERISRLTHAYNVVADWRIDLFLGTISDEDKESLIAWMQYIKDVKAIDTSKAPDIIWPDAPK